MDKNTPSKVERGFCFLLAVAFDLFGLNVIHEPAKPLSEKEVDKKIEDFKDMISRGEADWE